MLMLELDFSKVVASFPRTRYVGFVFQCDFFTVICVTLRACPQDQDFLAVDSTPAVETYFRGLQDRGVL